MFNLQPVLRRGATAMLACAALVGAGNVSAKIFTTSESVQDFRFDQEKLLYTTPDLDQVTWELTESNHVVLTSIDDAEVRSGLGSDGDVVGRLNLGGEQSGAGYDGEYTVYGSLNPGDSESTMQLMDGALNAMQSASDEQSLMFLFSGGRATGNAGTLYQSVGIFAVVYGISDVDWLGQYDPGASSLPPAAARVAQNSVAAPAAPLPATPLLLLVGLVGLRLVRRQAR